MTSSRPTSSKKKFASSSPAPRRPTGRASAPAIAMFVKLLTVDLLIPGCQSLKEKRYVLSSLKSRLRGRFNASVAEVDHQDKWQRSTIAVAIVGSDHKTVDETCGSVRRFIEGDPRVTVADALEEFR